jgi:hypothetical protein
MEAAMFDPDLVRRINAGRCFAFVGTGPSAEIGYPSWKTLAERVRDRVLEVKPEGDTESYDQFLATGNLPAVFRQAELDLGSRDPLVSIVKAALQPSPHQVRHPIYEYLAKWPFACYLTTNYDDELQKHLAIAGHHFQVIQNRQSDLAMLRDGVSHLIVKIHSDLEHPQDVVLTSLDYDRILTSPEGAYIRDKLRQVFEIFNVLIIGHSMTDPDLQLALATAKHTASPLHPIYMFLADATFGQVREFHEQYNIRLIPYKNTDGLHHKLHIMIGVADHFICRRDAVPPSATEVTEDEIHAATSLLIFRRLRTLASDEPIHELLSPLILSALASSEKPLSLSDIVEERTIAPLAQAHDLTASIQQCLEKLMENGQVSLSGEQFIVTSRGRREFNTVVSQRQLEEEQAYGQFRLELKKRLSKISEQDTKLAVEALRASLINAFRSRGLAMANVIVAEQSIGANELHDLFREFSMQAAQFDDLEVRAAFMEAAHAFLVKPNEPQKNYLASISQGFFLYHMAGLDPTCGKIRRDLFENTCWFLDSSVLIPLLAVGSHNHAYAKDLFKRLDAVNAMLFTTVKLLQEVWKHLDWAVTFVKNQSIESPEFLAAARVQEGYKQNLFIDGYIRMSADGAIGTFQDYLDEVAPAGLTQELLAKVCERYEVHALRVSEIDGFDQGDWGEIESLKDDLAKVRSDRGTFRGEFQVEAEAEILGIIYNVRQKKYRLPGDIDPTRNVYFVSQSLILDVVSQRSKVLTWTPEAVYRYVCSLSSAALDPDLLQQCMLHEYFYAGVSFIDKSRYLKFFGPSINQSRIAYQEQVDKYLQETEQTHRRQEFDEEFDRIPDLEKPFFVAQMGWQLARTAEKKSADLRRQAEAKASTAEQRARTAEARAKAAEDKARVAHKKEIKAQQEANRLRNLQDPKHLRKRERQAKKRVRRKRKKKR